MISYQFLFEINVIDFWKHGIVRLFCNSSVTGNLFVFTTFSKLFLFSYNYNKSTATNHCHRILQNTKVNNITK